MTQFSMLATQELKLVFKKFEKLPFDHHNAYTLSTIIKNLSFLHIAAHN